MKRLTLIGLGIIAVLFSSACSDAGAGGGSNDPQAAIKVLNEVYSTSAPVESARSVVPRTMYLNVLYTTDFTGSQFSDETAGLPSFSVDVSSDAIVCEGNTYSVHGIINYAYTSSASALTLYAYADDFTIIGPDYDGSVDADLKYIVAWTETAITLDVIGTMDGVEVNESISIDL